MKKIILTSLLYVVSAMAFAQSEIGVNVSPRVLEERDGKLYMELMVNVSPDMIRRNDHFVITPELRSQGTSREFPQIMVNGSRKTKTFRRARVLSGYTPDAQLVINNANRKDPRSGLYSVSVPYENWMNNSVLFLNTDKSRCCCGSDLISLNTGVSPNVVIPAPYVIKFLVTRVAPQKEEVKRRDIRSQAFLDFPVGSSVIMPGFRNNPAELAKIREILSKISDDKDVAVTGMTIRGYASPEGSEAMNLRLSNARAGSLKTYIKDNYNISADIITSSGGGEDWATFRTLMESSNIDAAQEILAIIDNDSNLDTKERQLRALSGGTIFRTLLNDYFPKLRRVDYKVDFNIRAYEDSEMESVYRRDPTMLSSYELYTLATQTTDENLRAEIISTMERLYPDNPAVAVNAIARNMEAGNVAEAGKWVAVADKSPEALNNIGVIYMMEGNYEAARGYFNQAIAAGSNEARHNLKELETKLENAAIIEKYKGM